VVAFLLWGLFPLYWKLLAAVPALEVVAHRTAWGFVAVAAWVTLRGRWADARFVASRPETIARLAGSAVLIALNWLLYVWAVVHDHVVEASLGYFINPLVNVLLGVLVLGERLSRAQRVAVTLAAAGVAVLTVGHGRLPWIALALAVSFGLYGLARKTVGADAVVGLLWETGLLAPLAAGWLLFLEVRGSGAFGPAHPGASVLLALGGAVTAVPLVLFALGARALPLSTSAS
jgi:chloramphenicol-sensitive protein RarD